MRVFSVTLQKSQICGNVIINRILFQIWYTTLNMLPINLRLIWFSAQQVALGPPLPCGSNLIIFALQWRAALKWIWSLNYEMMVDSTNYWGKDDDCRMYHHEIPKLESRANPSHCARDTVLFYSLSCWVVSLHSKSTLTYRNPTPSPVRSDETMTGWREQPLSEIFSGTGLFKASKFWDPSFWISM